MAIEGDWPDAAAIDAHVRPEARRAVPRTPAFSRFPTWMWRNRETRDFVDWLFEHNQGVWDMAHQVSVYGLDLYSLSTSIAAVLEFLDDVDPDAARVARTRYGCFSPFRRASWALEWTVRQADGEQSKGARRPLRPLVARGSGGVAW